MGKKDKTFLVHFFYTISNNLATAASSQNKVSNNFWSAKNRGVPTYKKIKSFLVCFAPYAANGNVLQYLETVKNANNSEAVYLLDKKRELNTVNHCLPFVWTYSLSVTPSRGGEHNSIITENKNLLISTQWQTSERILLLLTANHGRISDQNYFWTLKAKTCFLIKKTQENVKFCAIACLPQIGNQSKHSSNGALLVYLQRQKSLEKSFFSISNEEISPVIVKHKKALKFLFLMVATNEHREIIVTNNQLILIATISKLKYCTIVG